MQENNLPIIPGCTAMIIGGEPENRGRMVKCIRKINYGEKKMVKIPQGFAEIVINSNDVWEVDQQLLHRQKIIPPHPFLGGNVTVNAELEAERYLMRIDGNDHKEDYQDEQLKRDMDNPVERPKEHIEDLRKLRDL